MGGDGDLQRERGDALRRPSRHLLLPALQGAALAAGRDARAEGGGAADPHRRARREQRPDASGAPGGARRAAGGDAHGARRRARRAGDVLRPADPPLPRRPCEVQPRRARVRLDLLHAPRRPPCARGGGPAPRRVAPAPGFASAHCNPAGSRWAFGMTGWQIGVTVAAAVVALAAEAAAVVTALRTREFAEDGPPPLGRIHFFALAASAGNVLFLGAIVLDGIGAGWWSHCGQA